MIVWLNKGIRCKTETRWDAHGAVSMEFASFLRKQVIGESREGGEQALGEPPAHASQKTYELRDIAQLKHTYRQERYEPADPA